MTQCQPVISSSTTSTNPVTLIRIRSYRKWMDGVVPAHSNTWK